VGRFFPWKEAVLADCEIMPRIERRRTWTAEEKASLLAEIEAEGGKVTVIARRYRISKSVLYGWRADFRAAAAAQATQAAGFVPVEVFAEPPAQVATTVALSEPKSKPERQGGSSPAGTGGIEITLAGGARVSVDAFVNERALSRVLRAMKGVI
jgi:transposase